MQSLGTELDQNMAQDHGRLLVGGADRRRAQRESDVQHRSGVRHVTRRPAIASSTAYEDGSLGKLSDLGRQLKVTQDGQTLDQTLRAVGKSLDEAVDSARKLGIADAASIQQKLNSVQQGASQLADASQQLAEGVQQLVDKTRQMGGGLDQASAFLLAMKRDAADPPMSGFYIPPEILTQAEFKKAATLFISADGHTARYLVQTALDPFSTAAMDQVQEIVEDRRERPARTPRWPTPRSRWWDSRWRRGTFATTTTATSSGSSSSR